jgi:hypothetical protein
MRFDVPENSLFMRIMTYYSIEHAAPSALDACQENGMSGAPAPDNDPREISVFVTARL